MLSAFGCIETAVSKYSIASSGSFRERAILPNPSNAEADDGYGSRETASLKSVSARSGRFRLTLRLGQMQQ